MASFGTRLKQEREQRGITLDTVALSTKIGTRFLRALEEDHFDQLPGGIFNRGFVRAYARCVGLDEDQMIADYLTASGEAQPKVAEPIEPSRHVVPEKHALPEKEEGHEREREADGREKNLPWGMFAVVLVVVVLGLAIWRFLSREPSTSTPSSSAGISASSSSAQTSPPVSRNTVAQDVPVASATTPEAANPSPAPGSFVVLIKASEDSWVSITDADGKPVFEDTMEASTEKSIEARSEIKVKVGNLGGLDFWFNGTKLATQGDEGEVKTLTFDATGLRPSVPKPQEPDASPPAP